MIFRLIVKLRQCSISRFVSIGFFSSFRGRSPLPRKQGSTNWNTNNTFVLANPLLSILEKCRSIAQSKQIHARMILCGLIADQWASSRLISFSANSESRDLDYSVYILNNTRNLNTFSWNAVIRGCSESEYPLKAVLVYKNLLQNGRPSPDNYTYPVLFKICAGFLCNPLGHSILGHVLQLGFHTDIFVHNSMIHLLASCEDIVGARKVFDISSVRDLVSWNSIINAYVHRRQPWDALKLYHQMVDEEIEPDEVTMIGVVTSCGQLEDLTSGKEFHEYIIKNKVELTPSLANALTDMYVKCNDLCHARELFDSMTNKTVVSWTTMVVGYAKSGLMNTARALFDEMPERDIVPWNAMICGYAQADWAMEALSLFHDMQSNNVKPDEVTLSGCLSACGQLGALDIGMWIHHYIEKEKLSLNVAVGTALVDMYAKCGNIVKAVQIFKETPEKNSLTYSALICGLAFHGKAHDALSYFKEMTEVGLIPDKVTYLGVLSACCHGGLVEEGRRYLSEMSSIFKLSPTLKHYSCMVNLLGRAGLLEEAEVLVGDMDIEADAVVWGALFFACRMHGNLILGERAASRLFELDPHDSGNYVLLATMYRESGRWEEAGKIARMMRDREVDKVPGCSSIEVNGVLSEFIVRDKSHPETELIYECLIQLFHQLELVDTSSGIDLGL